MCVIVYVSLSIYILSVVVFFSVSLLHFSNHRPWKASCAIYCPSNEALMSMLLPPPTNLFEIFFEFESCLSDDSKT